jgi:hypothetical protein
MSEPFPERLSRFTPDAGKLNRDLLLFEAGRSSVRRNRGWATAAILLAASQFFSLLLLWPYPRPMPSGLSVAQVESPSSWTTSDRSETREALADGSWSRLDRLPELQVEARTEGDLTLIDSGPPLRAFASLPSSLLN